MPKLNIVRKIESSDTVVIVKWLGSIIIGLSLLFTVLKFIPD